MPCSECSALLQAESQDRLQGEQAPLAPCQGSGRPCSSLQGICSPCDLSDSCSAPPCLSSPSSRTDISNMQDMLHEGKRSHQKPILITLILAVQVRDEYNTSNDVYVPQAAQKAQGGTAAPGSSTAPAPGSTAPGPSTSAPAGPQSTTAKLIESMPEPADK